MSKALWLYAALVTALTSLMYMEFALADPWLDNMIPPKQADTLQHNCIPGTRPFSHKYGLYVYIAGKACQWWARPES
jgi:hypothetical protein